MLLRRVLRFDSNVLLRFEIVDMTGSLDPTESRTESRIVVTFSRDRFDLRAQNFIPSPFYPHPHHRSKISPPHTPTIAAHVNFTPIPICTTHPPPPT